MNAELKQKVKNNFEESFVILINNAVFIKNCEK